MKKRVIPFFLTAALALFLTSCYTYTYTIGEGAQTGRVVEAKNHYLIYGLAPLEVSNPTALADGATDYDVKIEHSFVDGLLAAITFGIYTPTTTTVTQ